MEIPLYMKKRFILVLLISTIIGCQAFAQAAKHVILITIDGFRPDFYLDPSWGAVNLRQLMSGGVYARGVNGVFPTVTFPSHTTIVTGVMPAKHGIYYNAPFEPTGSTGRWYWEFKAIQSPTLWDAVRKAGLTSGAVLWPVTAGAPIDFNIPDIWEVGNADRRKAISLRATPEGLWEEMEQYATGRLEANDFNLDKDYLSMDDNVARMAAYIIRKHKPAFVAVHLPAVDHAEHAEGRDGDQVRRAVAGADRSIHTIIEALDKAGIRENTAIIVTGDHGFVNRHTSIHLNVLLTKAGLINDLKKDDWKAQFHSSGGSAFLYLKDKRDSKTLAQVKKILNDLPASQKKLFRIIEGRQLEQSGADPDVPLALAAEQGITFGGSFSGDLLRSAKGGAHGYFPDFFEIRTGFVASGAGFEKGVEIPVMELTDIAPIVAALLGIGFEAGDGVLYPGVLSK